MQVFKLQLAIMMPHLYLYIVLILEQWKKYSQNDTCVTQASITLVELHHKTL